jgi:hypothetical protein
MIFLEQMILVVIVFEGISIGLVGIRFHHVDDLFGLGHIQLLVQGVESSASLSPVFGDSLGRLGLIRLSVLSINGLFDNQSPLFDCIKQSLNESSVVTKLLSGLIW